jgi:hypothetical protein
MLAVVSFFISLSLTAQVANADVAGFGTWKK